MRAFYEIVSRFNVNKNSQIGNSLTGYQAEREGFEPSVPLRVHWFSRPARSAALSPLRSNDEPAFEAAGEWGADSSGHFQEMPSELFLATEWAIRSRGAIRSCAIRLRDL